MNINEKYEILRKLGEGSYGEVFLARHRQIGKLFAIKHLKIQLDRSSPLPGYEDPRKVALDRFKREAVVLQEFIHPHSVPLRDFGRSEEGGLYMVIDYIEGVTLSQLIKKERGLDLEKILDFTDQILDVLESAHKKGIVHRDLKPANIMVGKESTDITLLDFGLAKTLKILDDRGDITKEGEIVGTPMYMAPEQASGGEIDGRTDLYALGMIMYEMATGKKPFDSHHPTRTLHYQLTKTPSTFAQRAPEKKIPSQLESLVFRAIEKDPQKRFPSAADMRKALLNLKGKPLLKRKSPPPGGKKGTSRQPPLARKSSLFSWIGQNFTPLHWSLSGVFLFMVTLFLFFLFQVPSKKDILLQKARRAFGEGDYSRALELTFKAREIKKTKASRELLEKIKRCEQFQNLMERVNRGWSEKDYSRVKPLVEKALKKGNQIRKHYPSIPFPNREELLRLEKIEKRIQKHLKFKTLLRKSREAFGKKNYHRAARFISQALHLFPEEKEAGELASKYRAFVLYQEAGKLERKEKYKEAVKKIKKALSLFETVEFRDKRDFLVARASSKSQLMSDREWKRLQSNSSQGGMFRNGLGLRGVFSPPRQGRSPQGKIKKTYPTEMMYSQPLVWKDYLIYCHFSRSGGRVSVLRLSTGKKIWEKKTPDRIFASPARKDNRLFITTEAGGLYCFEISSGYQLWKSRLGLKSIYSSPLVVENTVYQMSGRTLYALHSQTGKKKWKKSFPTEMAKTATPAIYKNYILLLSTPLEGKLVVCNLRGKFLFEVKLFDFSRQKRIYTLSFSSPVVSEQGIVYVGHYSGTMGAYHLEKKKLLWRKRFWNPEKRSDGLRRLSSGFWTATPAVKKDRLYHVGVDGFLYGIDSSTGREIWRRELEGQSFSSPAISGQDIYVGDRSGHLYSFQCSRGSLKWKVKVGNWIEGAISVYRGVVYCGRMAGKVFAIH